MYQKPIQNWDPEYTTNFTTRFRPIPFIDNYDPTYINSDIFLGTQKSTPRVKQFQHVHDHIELYKRTGYENPPITHKMKTRALIENWQLNDVHSVFQNPFGCKNDESHTEKYVQSLIDENQFANILITKEDEPVYMPLSTNINFKCWKRMQYFPMNFGKLTIDGLVDTLHNPVHLMN